MIVDVIDDESARRHLNSVGLTLGPWHRIRYAGAEEQRDSNWRNMPAPRDARELLVFSQRALDWLPESEHVMAAFDDSTHLTDAQLVSLQCVLGVDLARPANLSGALSLKGNPTELKIRLSYFAFFCLLFETYVYVVSADSHESHILGLHDGYAYFIGGHTLAIADSFVTSLKTGKDTSPDWIARFSL